MKLRKIWNVKAAILAFEITFTFCFFMGAFVSSGNKPARIERYEGNYHYFINRGYPTPSWSGVSASNTQVDFPIIRLPFLTNKYILHGFDSHAKIDKIIDLSIFLPFFAISLLFFYFFPSYVFARATDENKKLMPVLYAGYVFFFIFGFFIYYFIFPQP